MLKFLLSLNNLGDDYKKIVQNCRSFKKTAVFGVPKTSKHHISSFLNNNVLYIAQNKIEADEAFENIKSMTKGDVVYIGGKGELLLSQTAFSKELYFDRLTSVYKILQDKPKVIITTIEAVMGLFPNKEQFLSRVFKIDKNSEISLENFSKKLIKCGYLRVDEVTNRGEFSFRGDIVDIFTTDDQVYRIDMFGDIVEKIKELDLSTKKSSGDLNTITIFPCCDVFLDENSKNLLNKIQFAKVNTPEENERIERKTSELNNILQTSSTSQNSELLPLTSFGTIFDYIDEKTTIVFDEYKMCKDVATSLYKEHLSRYTSLFEKGQILKTQIEQMLKFENVLNLSMPYAVLTLNTISSSHSELKLDDLISIKITKVSSYQVGNEEITRDIRNWLRLGYTIAICGKDEETARRLSQDLSLSGAMVSYKEDSDKIIDGAVVVPEFLSSGFVIQESKVAVIGTHDILKKATRKISSKKGKINSFISAEVGDYIVHDIHGIGFLESVSTIQTGSIIKDYAVVRYKNDDKLYIPADEMDSLVKFSGSEKTPKLSKIGGTDFEKIKERVRKSIKEMAIDLKELYSKRREAKGYKYQEDSQFQIEFEEDFPFDETVDQLTASKEIKSDLISGKVMDRLLVGDVGFGKTEVAFRAIFKVIEAGKQVCILAPTTILSYQHFQSAMERFKDFGIRIDYLNRFKGKKEQNTTMENLSKGKIDLICGTHRLLSKDINFENLGLLVLDEEQRFGVEHKEQIKSMKGNVNVLSMSATPIPRTLHMSLTGIRDISTIETPPTKRLPVQVYVTEETLPLIYDGINKELSRNGQVFILYNRVTSINSFANKLKEMMPNVRFIVAHGKMMPSELEKAIESFVLGEYDVLIATTIIENGINIPRANTMIVVDADRLGLSQLYQLKGRVGRSDKLAFVYFTYKEGKILTETAYKRLSAITEFTEFGSGFKIAMRDLEIRGSGNILGREQHGHMEQVGYDMYCKLLKETVDDLNGIVEVKNNVVLEINLSAFIPEDYITLSSARMEAYREIASVQTSQDLTTIASKLVDNYGTLPLEVENLCKISHIRYLADNLLANLVCFNEKTCYITLKMDSMKNEKLLDCLDKFSKYVSLDVSKDIRLNFRQVPTDKRFMLLYQFLKQSN